MEEIIIRIGKSSADNRIDVRQDVIMNQRYIADLHNPRSDNDAANKIYADSLLYLTAYPTMTGNTTTIDGFTYTVSSSSIVNDTYQPWKTFQNTAVDGWVAASISNKWIQMKYPIWMKEFHSII